MRPRTSNRWHQAPLAFCVEIVAKQNARAVTPHGLRRTCLTWITRLGFGRDAMDRIANHRTSTVTDVSTATATPMRTGGSWRAVARHVSACGDAEPGLAPRNESGVLVERKA